MKINLVMIAKNESRSLERCLRAARPLADRIILADTGSTDGTPRIARSFGAEVFEFPWIGDFSAARNFALEQSDGDWNLILDADEYVISGTRADLEAAASGGKALGVIVREDLFQDKEGIQTAVALLPRLLPAGVRYQGRIHEQPKSALPLVRLPLRVSHDGYLVPGKGERNLELLRQAAAEEPEDGYYQFQLAATLKNLGRGEESLPHFSEFCRLARPDEAFWAQGMVLYLYALADMGRPEDMERGLRLIGSVRSRLAGRADFCFACGIFYMKLVLSDTARYISYFPEIEASWKRCLALGEQAEDGTVAGTGSFKAAYNLGLLYEMQGDKEKAERLYRMAAEEGYIPGAQRLDLILRQQRGELQT